MLCQRHFKQRRLTLGSASPGSKDSLDAGLAGESLQGRARSPFLQAFFTVAQLISQNLLASLILLINHSIFSANRLYQCTCEPLRSVYSFLEPASLK